MDAIHFRRSAMAFDGHSDTLPIDENLGMNSCGWVHT